MRYMLVLFLLTLEPVALGSTREYKANDKNRIKVDISNQGANRITIKGDRIAKIVGNEDDYFIEGDAARGYVFLTPKAEAGKQLSMTIITESGLIQDVNCNVVDTGPTNIIIKKNPIKSVSMTSENQIINAIQDAITGNLKNYKVSMPDKNRAFPIKVLDIKEYVGPVFRLRVIQHLEQEKINAQELVVSYYPKALAIAEQPGEVIMVERI
jgi:hypothetical protein